MSPAHVFEPTYERLKRELMAGRWAQDTRLEAHMIGEDYGVSATPVRDCLNRLTGEGLVVMRPGEGYRVPRLTEKALRDMLELHRLLVVNAVSENRLPLSDPLQDQMEMSYAQVVLTIFVGLAQLSGNSATKFTVRALGERLHSVRILEPALLEGTSAELQKMRKARTGRRGELLAAISAYHERRIDAAAAMIAALSGPSP